jgi:alpha-ketoglutaric semialdehyde dehydrogenase
MIETRKDATLEEIDRAASAAAEAAETLGVLPGSRIAELLEKIADGIMALGDELLQLASSESVLPIPRLTGERARTVNQLRMFAEMARTGAWKHSSIDPALPDRKPLPRVDLRRTSIPIGPVAVWAASNFPLAFSVAGGDTASALAAGCPVVLKASPAHPATSDLTARVLMDAVASLGLPAGVFSILHGASPEVSVALIRHPAIMAGAFTGSLRAGRALFDAACQRPEPIPFFAEMGSVNPVFILPGALAERGEAIAEGLTQSVNLSVGQMCTCPGVVVALKPDTFAEQLRGRFARGAAGTMLTPGIAQAFRVGTERLAALPGVTATQAAVTATGAQSEALPMLFETPAAGLLKHDELLHEVFGPSTVLVHCGSAAELETVARHLEGSLTATIHGTIADLREHRELLAILERKAGRLVFNGFPTGVEVCASMQHGGPYPATTDPRFTSVGTAAIYRFTRSICYQDFPPEFLPAELRDT